MGELFGAVLLGLGMAVTVMGGMALVLWAIAGSRLDKALMRLTGRYFDAVTAKSKRHSDGDNAS